MFALLLALATVAVAQPHHVAPTGTRPSSAALDPRLGTLHHRVSTRNAKPQAFFDQGMKLIFAFNHEAAIKAFELAAELDPDLAMAHWGTALALGPNINRPMDLDAHKAAYAQIQKAIALGSKASVAERAYIAAPATRYSTNPETNQQPLQVAYKEAMHRLARQYPDDVDASVLYAESLLDLRPYGNGGHRMESRPKIRSKW